MLSARVGVALKRIGVDKVWVLEGGLKACANTGSLSLGPLEAPEVVAERFGVRLPSP